jgi:hypothetical protein
VLSRSFQSFDTILIARVALQGFRVCAVDSFAFKPRQANVKQNQSRDRVDHPHRNPHDRPG